MTNVTEDRPWGSFEVLNLNKPCTVKILSVNPKSRLSLQYHLKRMEVWRVISGFCIAQVGDEVFHLTSGKTAYVPTSAKHRIITLDQPCEILEIAYGEFDENDIVRLQDDYRRVE